MAELPKPSSANPSRSEKCQKWGLTRFLMKAGHLKPLGKPSQNGRKWFATVELEQCGRNRDWLDKAMRIVSRQIREMNEKQRKNPGCAAGTAEVEG